MKFILHPDKNAPVQRPEVLGRLLQAIASLPVDKAFGIEIKEHKPRRSLESNDKFHAMCSELADATGYSPLEVKNLVKNEMSEFDVVETPFGKVKRFRSSAGWNNAQMSFAIEILYRYGAEIGHTFREAA